MRQTVSFSKYATNVFFHILTRCNLRCKHCYINVEQHGTDTLPISVIEAWLGAFIPAFKDSEDEISQKKANIIFLGGEPTLHPELPDAVRIARSLGYASVTIDTNGYLFNDILSKVSVGEVDYFSFSLDGATRETNDTLRGQGSYEACIRGIKAAVSKGFDTSLIYTVSSNNIHELSQMPDIINGLGIKRFFIQVIGIRGRSAQHKDNLQILPQQWLDIVPSTAEQIAESGIIVTWPKVFLRPDEPFACAGIFAENYFVFPNGRVYRCPLCEDYPLHSMEFKGSQLVKRPKINESDFFCLNIPEGCVMNKLIQPDNILYKSDGTPEYRIACCMLKEEIRK